MAEEPIQQEEAARISTVGAAIQRFDAFFQDTYERLDLMPPFEGGQSNARWRQLSATIFVCFSPFGYTILMPDDNTGIFRPIHLNREKYPEALDEAAQILVERGLQACENCKNKDVVAQELTDRRRVVDRFTDMVGEAC